MLMGECSLGAYGRLFAFDLYCPVHSGALTPQGDSSPYLREVTCPPSSSSVEELLCCGAFLEAGDARLARGGPCVNLYSVVFSVQTCLLLVSTALRSWLLCFHSLSVGLCAWRMYLFLQCRVIRTHYGTMASRHFSGAHWPVPSLCAPGLRVGPALHLDLFRRCGTQV